MSVDMTSIDPFRWGLTKLSGAAATISTNPFSDLVNLAYPPLKAYLSNQHEIKHNNPALSKIMPEKVVTSVQEELKRMQYCANLSDRVYLYTALNATYDGNGSCLGSVLVVPLEDFHDREFTKDLEQEPILGIDALKAQKNRLSDNEALFQLARASGKTHYSVLKIIARVIIIALVIGLYFTPLGALSGLVICAGALLLYVPINRIVEERADVKAVKILTKRFQLAGYSETEAVLHAKNAAINCLKKIQLVHIDQRERGKLARLIVTKKGNLRFDPASPSISKRIRHIEQWHAKESKKVEQYRTSFLEQMRARERLRAASAQSA